MTNSSSKEVEPALEPGAGGHIHRFNAVRVPPQFGHSYLRCAYCGLSKHLASHNATTCDICTRVSADSAGAMADGNSVAFTAYNQAIEDAKEAIRGEGTGTDAYCAATFINAIARKCSPHVYVNRLPLAASPATKEEDEGLIALLLNWRKWYSEDLFSPWTIEEAERVHAEFPGAVDRISADFARGTIDNIIKDIRAGKHHTPLVSDYDPDA